MANRLAYKLADATIEQAAHACIRDVPFYGYVNAGFPENLKLVGDAVNDAVIDALGVHHDPAMDAIFALMAHQVRDAIGRESIVWERLRENAPVQFSGGTHIQAPFRYSTPKETDGMIVGADFSSGPSYSAITLVKTDASDPSSSRQH